MVWAPPAAAQPARPAAVDYSKDSAWLCLPGRADVCSRPVAAAALNPDGYGPVRRSEVAKDPAVDCFYVYPTVSRDPGMNSDLVPGSEEQGAAQSQFARFASVCRTYAPLYRQMTVGAVLAAAAGGDLRGPGELAFADVLAAWRTYLAKYNKGRPFVLIGHSQGSLMLIQLIARVIEGKPAARQMLRAYLPGFNVLVPPGKTIGGSFKSTPLCGSPAQTRCVVSWVSFRENNPPPEGALFGIAPPGLTVGCVNPARPGSRGWEPLDSHWSASFSLPVPGGPISWSTTGPPPAPYLRTEGLGSGRCVNDGRRGYLSIRVNADPKDARTDRVYGEVGLLGMFIPGWGMHLADVAEAQGDMIRQIAALSRQR